MGMQRLFVLGDSISIGYGPFLEKAVAGWLHYDRKSGLHEALKNLDVPTGANGGDSGSCLAYLKGWQAKGGLPADFLLLNCGLHDMKHRRDSKLHQVPLAAYQTNLEQIVAVVKALGGVRLIWVRTTPVNEKWHHEKKDFDRWEADLEKYNAVADGVMQGAGEAICDLHGFTKNIIETMSPDGVHFTEEGSRLQGAFLAGWLKATMDR